jgi:hypothetical protein
MGAWLVMFGVCMSFVSLHLILAVNHVLEYTTIIVLGIWVVSVMSTAALA